MGFLLKKEFIVRKRTSSFGHRASVIELVEMSRWSLSSYQRPEKSKNVLAKQKHQD
jgi:hypothetical protein